ncbi:hypothetical protein FOCC_FOCC012889 [Frankliniella occidentalis]|nr:hypothetical protein FOCC_FOCC012889 [Frankliniella occidentalis]
MKQQSQQQGSSQTQLGSCAAVPSYLPSYHPHHGLHHHAGGHHHPSTGTAIGTATGQQQHPASQATQVNRLYGGGLVKAEATPVPTKARRSGVKRSRSSRTLQDCARATPSTWSDAMLHLNASGFAFESAAAAAAAAAGAAGVAAAGAASVWYPHQGTPQHQHHPHAPVPVAAPVPGATAADPLGAPLAPLGSVAWGAMFPHCREREDDTRVLWNSDSLLRLVPV